jgi:hypothetical protein
MPCSGSSTSPLPVMMSEASGRPRPAWPPGGAARGRCASPWSARWRRAPGGPGAFPAWPRKRSNSVKASAVAPAKPASTLPWCSLRTLRALPLTTMLPSVTWPSPPMATCMPCGVWRRTLRMVVPQLLQRLQQRHCIALNDATEQRCRPVVDGRRQCQLAKIRGQHVALVGLRLRVGRRVVIGITALGRHPRRGRNFKRHAVVQRHQFEFIRASHQAQSRHAQTPPFRAGGAISRLGHDLQQGLQPVHTRENKLALLVCPAGEQIGQQRHRSIVNTRNARPGQRPREAARSTEACNAATEDTASR